MGAQQTRSFYRAIKKIPPADREYMSPQEQRGDPPPTLSDEQRRSWNALSFYDTAEGVRRQARIIPAIGKYVARYDLPIDGSVSWEETLEPGHYDVRGDKELLKRCLTDEIEPL